MRSGMEAGIGMGMHLMWGQGWDGMGIGMRMGKGQEWRWG